MLAALVAATLGVTRVATAAEMLVHPEEISRTLIVQNLSVQGERVAGVVANLSSRRVRDVRLQVTYWWLWADEKRQGTNDPSFVTTELISDEIPPQGQLTFGYMYPAARVRQIDGDFIVDVKVIAYRVVSEVPVPAPY